MHLLNDRDDKGFISIMAIWIIAFLAVISAEFLLSVRNEMKTLLEMKSSVQTYYVAEMGFNKAVKAIVDGELDNFYNSGNSNKDQNTDLSKTFVWRLNSEMPPVAVGDAFFKVTIGNESGRLNINEAGEKSLNVLFAGLGFNGNEIDIMRDSIIDWVDSDDFYRINGAESDYYKSLKKPYQCKNSKFSTKDEILLVRGMNRQAYYSRNIPGCFSVLEDSSLIEKKSDIQTYVTLENRETAEEGIQQFLTLSGKEKAKKKKEYDYDKININASTPATLLALPGMNEKIVSDVIEYRKKSDFISINEFASITGPEIFSGIKDYVHVIKNKFYDITVDAWMADGSGKQKIKWIVFIDSKDGSKNIKILEKIINPDIYAGLEYYDYNRR